MLFSAVSIAFQFSRICFFWGPAIRPGFSKNCSPICWVQNLYLPSMQIGFTNCCPGYCILTKAEIS